MFFNCTSCSTRLELPDEQVVNRVLKVRCTGCGTVMVVRDPATNRGERPSETQWFYAVAGQQRGPVSLGALGDLVRTGEVDARTFLWAAGMAQWSRAGEIAALSPLFAPQAPPPLPPPVPAPKPPPPSVGDARAELEARARAEQEARAKAAIELAARARTEQELAARAKAEQELAAKAKAEQEAKAKAEQELAAKARGEQEAKAKAEQEAKAKAEQELAARAKAEREARAKAEQELAAKARAEQEARAKAEQELAARARAEQELATKAKAEQEAKARAEAELATKTKAEQEAKAKAEAELEAKSKAKAELAARQKAEIDALVRVELEAKAKADRAEQELRDAVSQALAAANATPEPPPTAPSSITHHIEEDFFSSPPPPAPVDIFANLDEKPDEQELADFRKTLRAARPEAGPRSPTRAEMRALAQEFSVVTTLEQHKKKHGLWIAIGVGAAAAIVAIVLLVVPPSGGPELAATDENFETFQRRLYDAPVAPTEPELVPPPSDTTRPAEKNTPPTPNKRPPTTVRKDPRPESGEKPASGDVKKPISAAQYAALTEDHLGKSEFKLDFDSSAAAKKAADEAAAKKAQRADELSAEVASAFGKKKSQFAKCGDDVQERIRVVFTVAPTGKISRPEVSGSQSSSKTQCIQQILERSIFPAGDTELTYSQVLVL